MKWSQHNNTSKPSNFIGAKKKTQTMIRKANKIVPEEEYKKVSFNS